MTAYLRKRALPFIAEPRVLWDMTAAEISELISAGEERRAAAARENELLAYNIGALVLTAFNAPSRYPKSPEAAFGRRPVPPADGGKAAFMRAAGQFNRRFADRRSVNDS